LKKNNHNVKDILEYIHLSGDEHDWKKVMESARNSGLSMDEFDKWSQMQPNYEQGCVQKWWGRYSKRISPGYIVNLAKQNPLYQDRSGVAMYKCKSGIPEPSENWKYDDLNNFLMALGFKEQEYLVYVPDLYLNENKKVCPKTQIVNHTVKKLLKNTKKVSELINNKCKLGAWIKINPSDGLGKKSENITSFRNVLLESDEMSLEDQYKFLIDYKLPCRAIVHSGNKSLHAIIKIESENESEYTRKVSWLYDTVEALGYLPDRSCESASKYVRLPGVERNGKAQYLLARNIGFSSFDEWRAYIDEKLSWKDIDDNMHYEPLPEFPLEVLPEKIKNFIQDISRTFKVPVEIPALSVLTAIGLALGRNIYAEIKEGVKARGNLYSFIFVARGERKSCVYEPILKPIEDWIFNKLPEYEELKRKQHLIKKSILKAENILTSPVKMDMHEEEAEKKLFELIKKHEELHLRNPNILAEDATREGIRNLMMETDGTVGIFSDDSRIFLKILLGMYSKESSEDIHLKAFDGTSPIRSHRASFESKMIIERPCEGLLLMVQNDFLKRLGAKQDFFDSGFFSRYLFCSPDSWVGQFNEDGTLKREYDEYEISKTNNAEYSLLVKRILDYSYTNNKPEVFGMSPDAKALWIEFYNKVESECGEGGDLYDILDFAIRYPCLALRLALIISSCRHFEEKFITHDDMQNALTLLIYYTKHTDRCFQAMKGYQLPPGSRAILKQIIKKKLTTFTVRDMQRNLGYDSADEIRTSINLLIEKNYVREKIYCKQNIKKTGRKPSLTYETNPTLLSKEYHYGYLS